MVKAAVVKPLRFVMTSYWIFLEAPLYCISLPPNMFNKYDKQTTVMGEKRYVLQKLKCPVDSLDLPVSEKLFKNHASAFIQHSCETI